MFERTFKGNTATLTRPLVQRALRHGRRGARSERRSLLAAEYCRVLSCSSGSGGGGEGSEGLEHGAVHCGAGDESHCSARAAILAASGLAPAPGACSFSSQRKAVEREKTKGPPGRC